MPYFARSRHRTQTIADGGKGLRAGQAAAWSGVRCHADAFHAEAGPGKLAFFLHNRALGCIAARQKLQHKRERSKKRRKGRGLSKKLALAGQAEDQAIQLAEDIAALADWMQNDILSLAGPDLATRRELFNFVIEELRQREELCVHRIRPVRGMLERHPDDLLAFAGVLDSRFAEIALCFHVPVYLVHGLGELQGLDRTDSTSSRPPSAT